MYRIIYVLLLFYFVQASGQSRLTFIEADTSTYNLYLRGEWDKLVKTGRMAIQEGIDYYYLRMRMGYAYYMKGKYRKAITHYKNALHYNEKDPWANEYLYYCYRYSGRYNDALFRTRKLISDQLEELEFNDSKKIISAGFSFTYSNSGTENFAEDFDEQDFSADGIQKATHNFFLPELSIIHRIGKFMILNHSFEYLNKNEFSYSLVNGIGYLSPEQITRQFRYSLSAEITPVEGFLVIPVFNYLNIRIPIFGLDSYGRGMGKDRSVYDYTKIRESFYALLLKKELGVFNLGISAGFGELNDYSIIQTGVHSTVYPLSNLNLYYTFNGYFKQTEYNDQKESQFIHHHIIGFKVNKNLWMELSGKLPDYINFYDVYSNILYNSLETTRSSFGLTGIIPLGKYKIQIITHLGMNRHSSAFFPQDDKFNTINNINYSSYSLTGGLRWKI